LRNSRKAALAAKSVAAAILVGAVVAACSPFGNASAAETRAVVIERDGNRIELQLTDAEIAAMIAGDQTVSAPAAEAPAADARVTETPAPVVEAPTGGAPTTEEAAPESGPIDQAAAERIALEWIGEGRVTWVERENDFGAAWEIEVTMNNNREVDVYVNTEGTVVNTRPARFMNR